MSMSNQAFQQSDDSSSENKLRILMADDNPQEHILTMLAAEGLSTPLVFDFVPNGSRLLGDLNRLSGVDELPNLIILELRSPRVDGYRTLEELQAHPLLWQIPIVVFSDSTRVEDQALCYARGAVLFETKPSSFSGMEEFLERAVTIAKPTNEYHDVEKYEIINITDVVDVTTDDHSRMSNGRSEHNQT